MATAKTELFTDDQNQIAKIGKALSHPARVTILQYLFQVETCVCGELVSKIGLAQSTISQHLKELKDAGLIKGNIRGANICYCIHQENWEKMTNLLSPFLLKKEINDENCCSF